MSSFPNKGDKVTIRLNLPAIDMSNIVTAEVYVNDVDVENNIIKIKLPNGQTCKFLYNEQRKLYIGTVPGAEFILDLTS